MADKNFDSLFENRIIPIEQGTRMYNEHTEHRNELLKPQLREMYQNPEFEDSRFVHVSLDDLKDYISFLDHINEQNPSKDVSGVRIYFGAYPNSPTILNKQTKYPCQQTVFMVPTVHIGEVDQTYPNMNHLPFYVKGTSENPYKGKLEIIGDLMLDYKKEERLKKANEGASVDKSVTTKEGLKAKERTTSTLFNEAHLSPPPL
jgi:hypothetical protein